MELQTFRTQDLSFPRTKGPYGELSFPRNESSRNFRSRDLSFSGNESFVELSFPSPFVLGNFRTQRTKVPGNFHSQGPFVPGNFRSHYPIGLVAALLCVLNYCMFGCDFTLMTLTPLWTSQLTLYVGWPAFAARLFVFVCQLASSHLFTLHSYLTDKNNTNTPKAYSVYFWKTNTTRPTTKQILTVAIMGTRRQWPRPRRDACRSQDVTETLKCTLSLMQ